MIIKFLIIIGTIIASLFFSNFFVFKNDLAEYNLSGDQSIYDNDNKLNSVLGNKIIVANFLNS